MVEILKQRKIHTDSQIESFLFPQLADLPKPKEMKNLLAAAKLILEHIKSSTPILIWGDYDVDGTTGTSLLVNFLNEFGIQPSFHIPNRFTEGYGINIDWFEREGKPFVGKKFLLITVDCGISNAKQIEDIKKYGADVIVTDHHKVKDDESPDCIVINPEQADCGFSKEKLAGVGVTFYLAAAIRSEAQKDPFFKTISCKINLKSYLEYVALGTVSDLVPLTITNRILVRAGLESLKETKSEGFKSLLASCNIFNSGIGGEDISFLIGPKLNAAGRLANSEIVVQLLTAKEQLKAKKLTREINELNESRRDITSRDLEIALSTIDTELVNRNKCVIIFGDYHQGVAGIVSSKIMDLYAVPVIVLSKKDDPLYGEIYVGSARSIDEIDIVKILQKTSDYLLRYGGHKKAAGLTVKAENIQNFKRAFIDEILIELEQTTQLKVYSKVDKAIECSIDDLMQNDSLSFFELLEPFGEGNEQPIFLDKQCNIVNCKTVGRSNEHLTIAIRGRYSNYKGIGFNLGSQKSAIQENPQVQLLFSLTKNRYRGTTSWQVRALEFL